MPGAANISSCFLPYESTRTPAHRPLAWGRRTLLLGGLALASLPAAQAQGGFATTLYPLGNNPAGVALGDLNGDGRLDLVAANQADGTLSVLLNQPAAPGTYGPATTYATEGVRCTGVTLGDLDGDGRLDLVTANQASGTIGVLLNSATTPGTFGPARVYATAGGNPNLVALGDLNGDGRLDVVTGNTDTNSVAVLLGSAATAGALLPAALYPSGGTNPGGVAIADVNADGRPDLLVGNQNSGTAGVVGVLLASATTPGTFEPVVTYPSGGRSTVGLVVRDLNGDGRLDLLTTNTNSNSVGVLLGQAAAGTFGAATSYPCGGTGPNFTVVADITNDGRPDLVISNENSSTLTLLPGLAAAGTFGPAASFPTGGTGPIFLAVGDVNADRRLDVVTTNYKGNNVAVLTSSYPLATAPALAAEVSLYPNPAPGAFTVQLPALAAGTRVQAELLNALGTVVHRQQPALPGGAPSFRVATAGLAPGVYTLRLQVGAEALARRVVLE